MSMVAIAILAGVGLVGFSVYYLPAGGVSTTKVEISTTCSISGQPGGIFLRVLSDSTLKPVAGVLRVSHQQARTLQRFSRNQ